MSAPSTVPWHRRLSVRLPILLAITLIGFDLIGERINGLVFRSFGLPDPSVTILVGPIDGGVSQVFEHADPVSADAIAERLLSGAERVDAGYWRPTPEGLAAARESLTEGGAEFLWTTATLDVVAASDGLRELVGSRWMPNPTLGDVRHVEDFAPVFRGEQLAGWFVLRFKFSPPKELAELMDAELAGFGQAGAQVLDGDEFGRVQRKMSWLARGVSLALILGIALLLAALLSRRVTVRLSRLTEAAALPLDSSEGPGRSRDDRARGDTGHGNAGRDEIGVLGGALRTSRIRVRELVETLERRDAERREWVAQVAHDLRTPMTALLACLERAEGSLDDPVVVRGALAVARQDTMRVCDLTEDLLEAARLETGAELVREPVLVGELVGRVLQGLGPLAEQRGVRLASALDPDLPTLDADGRRLLRVVENLVRNAVRHAQTSVLVEARLGAEGELELSVSDDGPGFAATAIESDPDSAGLGLRIVRGVLDAHGGAFEVDPDREGGARVVVRLPLPS